MFHTTVLTLVLALAAGAATAADFPKPAGTVSDFANVLTPDARAALASLIAGVERDTTVEIAVATVTSLDGLSVEEYAHTLFNQWGVGQKAKDNGVLVLVAPSEREMRIEVGYGLEGILPDGLAGAIMRDDFLPKFRDGDYNAGIVQGVQRVADLVRRNQIVTPEELAALEASANPGIPWFVIVPFMSIFVAIGGLMLGVGARNKSGFETLFGAGFGGIPFLLSSVFIPWSFYALGALAAVLFAIGYTKGFKIFATLPGSSAHDMTPGSWRSSGSSSSSWDSSSSSSSSSNSGSFGGGRSGGAGASGRW